jgi:hypothetical protein
MRSNFKLVAAIGLVCVAALMAVTTGYGGTPDLSRYRVTLVNLTSSQPFSPPVAATHQKAIRMFEVGELASDELAAIAQAGDEGPMFRRFSASDKVTQAVDIGRPVTGSGHPVGGFTDTVTFEISAAPGDRFSIATMLICTNDGFLGLDAVKLPKHGSQEFLLAGYDAGREENTERSEDLVDPCSELGPAPLRGDPNGNRDSGPGITTSPAQVIGHHPGVSGGADLSVALHSWADPVARVTIERIG